MADYHMVILSNPLEGREDEYNAWYDGRHLDDVLKLPGFKRARRLVSDNPLMPEPAKFKYMAIYELESDDIAATFGQFVATANSDRMPISPALDPDSSIMVYRAIGDVRTA